MGNPLFDIASVSANSGLTEELEATLLEIYGGVDPEGALPQVQILKTVSLLREALWAFIQTKTARIEFDYGKYAAENLDSYRQASGQLS